jgi:CheY-like chemotaxis protein
MSEPRLSSATKTFLAVYFHLCQLVSRGYAPRVALNILHTGQSGVERGADRAARAVGFTVLGFATYEKRDELGVLPAEVATDLIACTQRGARSAARATLEIASVLVICVPDAAHPNTYTGIEALRRSARTAGVPHWLVDPNSDLDQLAAQLRKLELVTDPLNVMITGPRLTRWRDGERLGWRAVAQLSLTPAAAPRMHRILVVDDHKDTAETACLLLRTLGHECAAATNAEAALRVASELDPDIAFLDIGLPDLSGYELARRLRATRTRPMFLAAITGWSEALDASRALQAGFDRHVIKPATGAIIRELLEHASTALSHVAA